MRTDAIYQRQEQLQLTIPETVSVVGCGGAGFWTAYFCAMSGVKNIILIDDDTIELSNLNRIPANPSCRGRHKVDVLEQVIGDLRDCRIEKHKTKIKIAKDCQVLFGTVFCCTDTAESQRLIYSYCKRNSLKYRRVGYDGLTLNVSKAFPLSFTKEPETTGYIFAPSWVIPAATAASLAVFAEFSSDLTFMSEMGKIVACDSQWLPMKIFLDMLENSDLPFVREIRNSLRDNDNIRDMVVEELKGDNELKLEAIEQLKRKDNIRDMAVSKLMKEDDIITKAIEQVVKIKQEQELKRKDDSMPESINIKEICEASSQEQEGEYQGLLSQDLQES